MDQNSRSFEKGELFALYPFGGTRIATRAGATTPPDDVGRGAGASWQRGRA